MFGGDGMRWTAVSFDDFRPEFRHICVGLFHDGLLRHLFRQIGQCVERVATATTADFAGGLFQDISGDFERNFAIRALGIHRTFLRKR